MKVIHKFKTDRGLSRILVPEGEILLVGSQNNESLPTAWVAYEAGTEVSKELLIVGTGWEVPEGVVHIGSAVCGDFVWHVYERLLH